MINVSPTQKKINKYEIEKQKQETHIWDVNSWEFYVSGRILFNLPK